MARILVIDDDVDVREALCGLLRLGAHVPVAPASPAEIKHAIQEGAFDLVITDLIMPDVDGLEVVRSVRRVKPGCPIVVVSGGSPRIPRDFGLRMAYDLGASATLCKPFLKADLLATISPLLGDLA